MFVFSLNIKHYKFFFLPEGPKKSLNVWFRFFFFFIEEDQRLNEYTVLLKAYQFEMLFSLPTGLMMQRLKITNHSPNVRWGWRFCSVFLKIKLTDLTNLMKGVSRLEKEPIENGQWCQTAANWERDPDWSLEILIYKLIILSVGKTNNFNFTTSADLMQLQALY